MIKNSTEQGRCDFCGEHDTMVAVSEQARREVRICEVCAQWALDEIAATAPNSPGSPEGSAPKGGEGG